jgi:diguanylate cyclase (GGDEF)-like protein
LRERLTEEVARAQRHGRPLTVALIDVDHFRELNDRAGLDAADRVLVEIGALLRDVCARRTSSRGWAPTPTASSS